MAILICWPTAIASFFLGIFIGFPYGNRDDLTQKIVTWPQLFAAIGGEYGLRARVYGILFFSSLVTGVIGFSSLFIGGCFCT